MTTDIRSWSQRTARAALAALALLAIGCGTPNTLEGFKRAGIEAFENEDYQRAIEYFRKGMQINSSDRDLLYYTGVSFRRESQYDSALVYLHRSAILHKNDRAVNAELYEVAKTMEEWEVAHSALSELIATGDREEDHYLEIARLWEKMEWPMNHFYYLRRYQILHPEDSTVYVELASVSIVMDSTDVGLALLDTAINRFGNDQPYLACKALIYGSLEKYEHAEKILRPMLAADTSSANLKFTLARVLASQGDPVKRQEALALAREAQRKIRGFPPLDSLVVELSRDLEQ